MNNFISCIWLFLHSELQHCLYHLQICLIDAHWTNGWVVVYTIIYYMHFKFAKKKKITIEVFWTNVTIRYNAIFFHSCSSSWPKLHIFIELTVYAKSYTNVRNLKEINKDLSSIYSQCSRINRICVEEYMTAQSRPTWCWINKTDNNHYYSSELDVNSSRDYR